MTRDDLMEEGEELPSDKLGWSGALYPGGPILEYSGVDLDVGNLHHIIMLQTDQAVGHRRSDPERPPRAVSLRCPCP